MKDELLLLEFFNNNFNNSKKKGSKMPILVIKFPEDNAKKVSASRFLSKIGKRDFSVIIDVEREELSRIFDSLNQYDCKIILAQDQSIKVDYEIYFLLYLYSSQLKKEKDIITNEKKNINFENGNDEKKSVEIQDHNLFDLLIKVVSLKKLFKKFQKNSDLYLSYFEKEYIISEKQNLYYDWEYRVRVLFDSITISALNLNSELGKLDEMNQLESNLKFIYAIDAGCNTLGEIVNFTKLQDVEELQKLDELIKLQIIHKNPFRLSETGKMVFKFIIDNLKEKLSFNIDIDKEKFLEELIENEFARTFGNLLITLCIFTIKNRIEIGFFPFKEFENLYIDPNQYE